MKKLASLAIIMLVATPPSWADQLTADRIVLLLDARNYDQLQQELSTLDQEQKAELGFGAVVHKLGLTPETRELLRGWVEHAPMSAAAWAAHGWYVMEVGKRIRGSDYASKVAPDDYHSFKEHAVLAEKDFTRAYELDPRLYNAVMGLMTTAHALGRNREHIESLYQRAIAIQPDGYSAHVRKWRYLLARWYGEEGEALAFARDVYQQAEPGTKLRTLLAQAHYENYADKQVGPYIQRPEIWAEIQGPMEEYLAAHPDDLEMRNTYARMAWLAKQKGITREQLTIIGGRWDRDVWDVASRFESARMWAVCTSWADAFTFKDVTRLLEAGDYGALQRMLDSFTSEERELLGERMPRVFNYFSRKPTAIALLNGWTAYAPSSSFAWVTRAGYLLSSTPTFGKNLELAEQDLERAYALDPKLSIAPATLIQVATMLGRDREYVEAQFQRALAANPASIQAHQQKLAYLLDPRYGKEGEAVAFARETHARAPRGSKLRTLLPVAHYQSMTDVNRDAYLQRSEVWQEVQGPMEEYLEVHPDEVPERNLYIMMAYRAKRYDIARAQMRLNGIERDPEVFPSKAHFERVRDWLYGSGYETWKAAEAK